VVSGCSICLDDDSTDLVYLNCGHNFCQDCAKSYFVFQLFNLGFESKERLEVKTLRENVIQVRVYPYIGIKCPHVKCNYHLDREELKTLFDSRLIKKFDKFTFMRALPSLDGIKFCPLENCGGFIVNEETAFGVIQICLKCNTIVCCNCGVYHPKLSCAEHRLKLQKSMEFLNKCIKDLGARRCPTCKVPIEKNGGCDNMCCILCKQPFVWNVAKTFVSVTETC